MAQSDDLTHRNKVQYLMLYPVYPSILYYVDLLETKCKIIKNNGNKLLC